MVSKAQFSLADASRFDAFRTAMFLRAMHYDVVLGINTDVLDGLDDLDHAYGDIFDDVPVLAARAGAYERLRDAGLSPRWWLHVGPTIAVECDQLQGAHVDGDEWELTADGGELLITARKARAATIDRLRTGVLAEIVTDAVRVRPLRSTRPSAMRKPEASDRGAGILRRSEPFAEVKRRGPARSQERMNWTGCTR